mmetsp:Transcript_51524/g.135371  ORF Transcript_51524/g.135371 Transcript_51524/m.135371 type:complete len:249 (-) Transcript_51524:85-831(-)
MLVWADFSSVPQANPATQALAIQSLPIYASIADALFVVAPNVSHHDSGQLLTAETYARRVWCRVEMLSHYARRGAAKMYIVSGDRNELVFEHIDESWLLSHINVFDGDLTCCRLKHKGMKQCDKEKLVPPMLGLYAELYRNKDDEDFHKDVYARLGGSNRDVTLPPTFEFVTEKGSTSRVLFGDAGRKLEMYLDDKAQQSRKIAEESKFARLTRSESAQSTRSDRSSHARASVPDCNKNNAACDTSSV